MTLIELLVVVMIMLVLVSVSIPLLRTTIRENRIREASRMLNVFVARAKARATELGRTVAIELPRIAPGSNAATQVYLAETPLPFAGDFVGARCVVGFDTSQQRWEITFPDTLSPSMTASGTTGLVRPGEDFQIQFGQHGSLHSAYRDSSNNDYVIRVPVALRRAVPPPDLWTPPAGFWLPGAPNVVPGAAGNDGAWGNGPSGAFNGDDDGNGIINDVREAGWSGSDDYPVGLPYQVHLLPRRASSTGLQLPEGTVIDLRYSGMGIAMMPDRTIAGATREDTYSGVDFDVGNTSGAAASNATPVLITFSPGGEIESVTYGGTTYAPTGPVHLLIGLLEQMVDVTNDPVTPSPLPWSSAENTLTPYDRNLADNTTVWVSIGYRTGTVTSNDNGWEIRGVPDFITSLQASREFAQSSQTMGGR